MPVTRPYRRTVRPFADGDYSTSDRGRYIRHPKYANNPAHFIRPFLMIQNDLQQLFDYIEPSTRNLKTYSFRIYQLLTFTCMEIEANFKAIFSENDYKPHRPTISTYRLIERSHRLSGYSVKLHLWREGEKILTPFKCWSETKLNPRWYLDYGSLKHNRHQKFKNANLENLLNAVAGLAVVLTAQFQGEDFAPTPPLLALSTGENNDGFTNCIGDYFKVKYPDDWPLEDRYEFDWDHLETEEDPFQKFDYENPPPP